MLRRLIVAFAFAFAAHVILAQAAATPPEHPAQPKKPAGNCTVSGRVVTAAEGTPLRSARVGLVEANVRKHPQVYATITDSDGRFELKQVEAGRYEFFASHVGYLEQHYQAKGTEDGAVLSLAPSQEAHDVLFRMVRAGVITGKVVDDTGEPMMNVNVSALHKPSEEEREDEAPGSKKFEMTTVSAGSTDDRGEYRLYGLKPGEYFVEATELGGGFYFPGQIFENGSERLLQEMGSQFAPLYYPGVLQTDQAQAITLSAGEEAQADFAMRRVKMVEVAGRVIGPDGGPPARSYVSLSLAGVRDWGGELAAGTDGSGEFSIKGVSPGTYFIGAGMRDKDKFYYTRLKIEVGETKIDSVVLALGSGAVIHGRIRTASGAALPPGRNNIRLQQVGEESGFVFGYNDVNKDGTFEISGVGDGSYSLLTLGLDQGWFVKSAHLGNEDVLQNGVQVEGGAVKGSLDIVISSDSGQIEGTLSDSEQNQPLAGVQIKAKPEPATDFNYMRNKTVTSDQNGHYLLKDLPPGKYKVTAKMPKASAADAAVKPESAVITLGDKEHRSLDFKLAVPKAE